MRPRRTTYEDARRCEMCSRFRQHYVKDERADDGYSKCGVGHCVLDRCRQTRDYFTCEHFAPMISKENEP